MTNANETMWAAIEASIRENRTVTVGFDDNAGGRVEEELLGLSDTEGDVENGDEHEFWGKSEAGHEWRVHVLTADVD